MTHEPGDSRLFMRIIAGALKGRKLAAPAGLSVRPTSDRLRERLFAILGNLVEGVVFWDSFAGSGAVGIEALSRGARRAIFSETAPVARRCLERNLAGLGILSDQFELHPRGALETLRELEKHKIVVDIVFVDPPYGGALVESFLRQLAGSAARGSGCVVLVEFFCKTPPSWAGWTPTRIVEQGQTCLAFLSRE